MDKLTIVLDEEREAQYPSELRMRVTAAELAGLRAPRKVLGPTLRRLREKSLVDADSRLTWRGRSLLACGLTITQHDVLLFREVGVDREFEVNDVIQPVSE